MHSPMFPANLMLATTDPAVASDSLNLLEDSFAAFLRQPRNRSVISPRPSLFNPSPRLPSALPPSASPRKFEPITPDRAQPVIPFFRDSDVSDLAPPSPREAERAAKRAAERERRIQWANSQPILPRMGLDELGVVDEDVADTMFNNMRRAVTHQQPQHANVAQVNMQNRTAVEQQQVPNMPHPAMKLELGILASANKPVLSPRAWGVTGEGIGGGRGWGNDILGSFAGQKRGESRTAPVVTGAVDKRQLLRKEERTTVRSVPVVRGRIGMDLVTNGIVNQRTSAPTTTTGPSGRKGRRMIKVIGGDPLKCHLCGQRFARRSNLFKHLRSVHEEVRKFACNQCSFKFKRQDHLLKHTRSVHNKVRKFQCEICGIGFAEKFNRDKHTRSIHYTKRAFQCVCGAYFQDRDKMMACLRCKRLPQQQQFHQSSAL